MIGNQLALILLPTNKCNVACEYCFEDKTDDFMSIDRLGIVIGKLLDHMERQAISTLTIYWQGGEIMMLPPDWFEGAQELIQKAADAKRRRIQHRLQSNMIGYNRRWNKIIAEMFENSVGTSMDFPNLYRRSRNGTPEQYTALWNRHIREARDAGIHIGVISIPNKGTLAAGAEKFYGYFVDELGLADFQLNMSFAGGKPNDAKKESLLDLDALSQFYVDLAGIWVERGYRRGIKLGPFDELMNHFMAEPTVLPCIWRQNCADEFVSIDARGHVAQCDCWVTSYPEYWFGNIFGPETFTELLKKSQVRRLFQIRPEVLVQAESCIGCDYLSICHGGCPVRAYANTGKFLVKDPYCQVYKALFSTMETLALTAGTSPPTGTEQNMMTAPRLNLS